MKFRRFLVRNALESRVLPISSVAGARHQTLVCPEERSLGPYRGPFEEHVLILVHEGMAVLQRQGERTFAGENDAMLIGRGEGGQLTFTPSEVTRRVRIEIMTFDERAVAATLRNHPGWESLALSENPHSARAFSFRDFQARFPTEIALPVDRFRAAIFQILEQYRPGMPEFLRDLFYRKRWALCVLLESFVILADGTSRASAQYVGGASQLQKDCLLYMGIKPESLLNRRRCELATAWLRCGHSIEEVAQALGYSSRWEFECTYSGVTKRRCRDVQKLMPLTAAEPEELVTALQPFWWKSLRLTVGPIPTRRIFTSSVMSEEEEQQFIGMDAEWA